MNHWPFILGAYGVTALALILLTAWSWWSMRAAEAEADALSQRV